MATIYLSYKEISDLLKESGKVPKQITRIEAENNSIKAEVKLLLKFGINIRIESCHFPKLQLKIAGTVPNIVLPFAKIFFTGKFPDWISVTGNILSINVLSLLNSKGYNVSFVNLENIGNQLKIELENLRKI